MASAAVEDGAAPLILRKLASIGAGGAHVGNSQRDLVRKMSKHYGIKIRPLKVEVCAHVNGVRRVFKFSVLLPHEVFHAICKHNVKMWRTIFDLEPESLAKFWEMNL